ncbi:hypothetical protein NEIELOOT_02104 [Neisseria elongata subsp. glycolytica ATCC 29315]|uniref:Uncharacterized protein n=1 Tax=Neisseria elongata subsp. glycolytica ATCC 29315 TaxID=546263 RepID=D4DSQ9_NEIEG|nr:hypothetical protein NEIELOOT_02104 [Neisseria elongata subsp. glycolytica ATCC 29315]
MPCRRFQTAFKHRRPSENIKCRPAYVNNGQPENPGPYSEK